MARRNKKEILLSFTESITLLYGDGPWKIRGIKHLKLPPIRMADGPSGLRKTKDDNSLSLTDTVESVCYPCPALLASSFDDDLVYQYGRMLGRECKANGVDALLGPGMNIKRNPLCGRNFEYYSEDPYLSGMLAASFVKGIQSYGVAACLKHFACNNQESYRMVNDSIVDQRALHELYLRGFQIAIAESKPWMVMASYNKINGVYVSESRYLLTETLKNKWKFDGVVVSDWGAVNDPIRCHENGLDVEMPCFGSRFSGIAYASRMRKNYAQCVRDSAQRVLKLGKRTHDERIKVPPFSLDDGHALAVEIAEKSMVLVKNEGALPLRSLANCAIIGEIAEKPRFGGAGSSQVRGYKTPSFIQYCRDLLGEGKVNYAPGYSLKGEGDATDLSIDALDLASRHERVLYFMGTSPLEESEGFDREELHLSDDQVQLFYRLLEVNPNIIVILNTGSPVEAGFMEKALAGILTYFPGEGGAEALYNILLGNANPSGHLAETWPSRNYEVPSFGFYPGGQMESLYRESIFVGYRYYISANEGVRFPFGYGLSYSKFAYGKMTVSAKKITSEDKLTITVPVTNKTKRAGDALVQIYVQPPEKRNVYKATRTLQGYAKVHLEGSEKKEVTIELDRRAFEHYDVQTGSFQIEGGTYTIQLADSCIDIVQEVNVEVQSDLTFPSMIDSLSIYYHPPKDGFWQFDDAFEKLLGRIISITRDPREKPYSLNSTIRNIKDTFIGKRIIAKAEERFKDDPMREVVMKTMMDMPLRAITLSGMKEKYAQVITDMANGRPVSALFHLLVPKR